jgi:hypothetical protein
MLYCRAGCLVARSSFLELAGVEGDEVLSILTVKMLNGVAVQSSLVID